MEPKRTRRWLLTSGAAIAAYAAWQRSLGYTGLDASGRPRRHLAGQSTSKVTSLTTTQRWETVRALRTVGFAAWLRTPSQGSWPFHIHATAVSAPDLAEPAADQIHDYYFGRNGLANHAADDTPPAYRVAFTWWEKYRRG